VMVQNHARQRAHSTFYNIPLSLEIWPRPVIEMNPDDARERGIAEDDLVEVFNGRGSVTVHARLNLDYPRAMCSIAEGWKQSQFVAGNLQELTNPDRNPRQERMWGHTNIPHYDTRVQVRRAEEPR
jgi:anaerobic dimethyl sulfoxide reductase subunit A